MLNKITKKLCFFTDDENEKNNYQRSREINI